MKRSHARITFSVAVAALGLTAGCDGWSEGTGRAPYNGYQPSTPSVGAPPSTPASECIDPTGFGGKGCFRCAPTTNAELLSACTMSHFETFDNAARITGF